MAEQLISWGFCTLPGATVLRTSAEPAEKPQPLEPHVLGLSLQPWHCSWVILGRPTYLSGPQSPHMQNGGRNAHLGILGGLDKIIPFITYCLTRSKHQYKNNAKLLQLCLTLCDPMDCSPPGSSVHGISQARVLEWVAISSSKGSSELRNRTCVSYVSCIGRRVLYL